VRQVGHQALNLCEPFSPRSRRPTLVGLSWRFATSLSQPVFPLSHQLADGFVSKFVSIGFRSVRSRDASGAPVLRDQGPIGRPGMARPIMRRRAARVGLA
jgi:hypothetical protein